MLTNVRYNEDDYEFPCLLVLGSFDAIHTGHAELLKKAKLQAKINGLDLGVMVFINGKGGDQICTFEEKLALLEQYNVKFVLSVEFTDEFKKTAPLDFLGNVEEKLNVKAYMSGKDFRFGAGAKGKSSTLKSYGEDEDNGVWYMSVKDLTADSGEKISASKIKELLEGGDITAANALLGRNYSLTADVVSCAENGEETSLTLAYPAGKVQIKHGVYAAKCLIGETEYEGCATCGEGLKVQIKNLNGLPEGEKVTVEFTAALCGGEEVAEETAQDVTEQPAQEVAEEAPAEIKETVEELAVTEDVTPDESNGEPQGEAQPEKAAEETVEEVAGLVPEEEAVPETQVERAEEPVVEVFAEDSGFDDDYYEEDFLKDQPAEEPAETTETTEAEITEPEEVKEETTEEPADEDNVD